MTNATKFEHAKKRYRIIAMQAAGWDDVNYIVRSVVDTTVLARFETREDAEFWVDLQAAEAVA